LAAFVALLTGRPAVTGRPIEDQVRDAVLEIRRPRRAVTPADYETLALAAAHGQAARAHCLPGYNLTIESGNTRRAGSVSVVILPARHGADRHPQPSPELLSIIRERMEDARLVTTRLHLVGPRFVPVHISAVVALKPEASAGSVAREVRTALEGFLDAYAGPVSGEGWTFGRDVFTSELFDLIERQPGVDYVAKLELSTDEESRIRRNAAHEITGVDLWENELPRAEIREVRVVPSDVSGEE
jgi:predicted phage baseplate assembly protein